MRMFIRGAIIVGAGIFGSLWAVPSSAQQMVQVFANLTVEASVNGRDLIANPYAYRGKIIEIPLTFQQMTDEGVAIFGMGLGSIGMRNIGKNILNGWGADLPDDVQWRLAVKGAPTDKFLRAESVWLLAVKFEDAKPVKDGNFVILTGQYLDAVECPNAVCPGSQPQQGGFFQPPPPTPESVIASGNADRMVDLGYKYEMGAGVQRDLVQAVRLYRAAADRGNKFGQNNLGNMYAQGLGGLPKDDFQAVKFLQLAAAQGLALAQRNLAKYYETGGGGLEPNIAQAKRLYKLAADQNDGPARDSLARLGGPDGAAKEPDVRKIKPLNMNVQIVPAAPKSDSFGKIQ